MNDPQYTLTAALAPAGDAVAACRALPRPIGLAMALRTLALILRRLRQKGESRDRLQEALSLVEPTGSALWRERWRPTWPGAACAADGTHAPKGRSTRWRGLAARGLTNGQIARALHMSDKTVEAH